VSTRHTHGVEHEAVDARSSAGYAKPERPLERLAASIGNRSFGQAVARMRDGDGILPGGVVHPDVEAAIRGSRGRGHPLDSGLRRTLEEKMGAQLDDVRVHTDERAVALARAVSARAFTVGSDIYFGRGEFQAHGDEPSELVAHEVTHVLQQRGAPDAGPLTVSQPGDSAELEAEAVARDVTG
jgi:Domain of unknown function (DUF4157)